MSKIGKAIIIAVIAFVGFALITSVVNLSTPQNKYAVEAVRVLEKYKNFDIDAKEASNRLHELMDEVKAQQTNTTSEKKKRDFSSLWRDLLSIHTKLYHYGSATGYEVDEAIKAIKQHY